MHNIFYSYIPYLALVLANTALIVFLTIRQKNSIQSTSSSSKKSSANRTVLAITLLFIVMTFPSTIGNIFYTQWITYEWGLAAILTCDAIDFTYHAISFPVLMITNIRFRQEFLKLASLIGIIRKRDIRSVSTTPNLTNYQIDV